jgi:hypothetical protein
MKVLVFLWLAPFVLKTARYSLNGISSVRNIIIITSSIKAHCGVNTSSIGNGESAGGISEVRLVTIFNSTINIGLNKSIQIINIGWHRIQTE